MVLVAFSSVVLIFLLCVVSILRVFLQLGWYSFGSRAVYSSSGKNREGRKRRERHYFACSLGRIFLG